MLTPVYKRILRPALPLLLAAALGVVLLWRLGELRARDPAAGHTVILNEVCAKNLTGYAGAGGQPVPWLELCNVSGQDVDLGGYTLSNDPDWPDQYTFPAGAVLPGQGNVLLLVLADGAGGIDADGVLHLNFIPRYQDETLTLYAPDGSVADTLHYDELPYDMTCGRRLGDAVSTGYFAAATPGTHNPAEFWQADAAPVELGTVTFSTPGGFYQNAFSLTLTADDPEALILYTTDGSEPAMDSALYTGPIPIRSRAGEANVYAARAATLRNGWLQNYAYRYAPNEADKCTTVTARLYKDGVLGASVRAETYWVDVAPHTVPVVSVSAAPDSFFGPAGIYMPGVSYFTTRKYGQTTTVGNFSAGRRVPAYVTVTAPDGSELLHAAAKVSVTGDLSRSASTAKNLSVRLQGAAAGLLPAAPGGDALPSFVLRGGRVEESGASYPALYQDAFLSCYLGAHGLPTLQNRPVALYLCGEYWGLYTLRESKNKDFFARHYGISPSELYAPGIHTAGTLNSLWAWADAVDRLAPGDLAAAEAMVDIDSYLDYLIAGMYLNNTDDLYEYNYNTVAWRTVDADPGNACADGRWRFLLNDLDWTLAGAETDPFAYLLSSDFSFAASGGRTLFAVPDALFQKLWPSAEFRARFAAALRTAMAGVYAPEKILPAWEEWCAQLRPEMPRELDRQTVRTTALAPLAEDLTGVAVSGRALTMEAWEQDAAAVRDFLARRAGIMLQWLDVYLA